MRYLRSSLLFSVLALALLAVSSGLAAAAACEDNSDCRADSCVDTTTVETCYCNTDDVVPSCVCTTYECTDGNCYGGSCVGGGGGSDPYCGDGACNNGETATQCPQDCGSYTCCDGVQEGDETTWTQDKDCDGYGEGGSDYFNVYCDQDPDNLAQTDCSAYAKTACFVPNRQDCNDDDASVGFCGGCSECTEPDATDSGSCVDVDSNCPGNSCTETYDDSCSGYTLLDYDGDCNRDSVTVSDYCSNSCDDGSCTSCSVDCPEPSYTSHKCAGVCGCSSSYGDSCGTDVGVCSSGSVACDGSCSGSGPDAGSEYDVSAYGVGDLCSNGLDDDCDGDVDCADSDCSSSPDCIVTCFEDSDGDGFGDASSSSTFVADSCSSVSGWVSNDGDCDDSSACLAPGRVWYHDADGDGYVNQSDTVTQCSWPGSGWYARAGVCAGE